MGVVTITVVLTREPPRNDELRTLLAQRCRVLEVPLTTTSYREVDAVEADIAATSFAHQFGVVAFTSARAARYAQSSLRYATTNAVVAAVGAATASALRDESALGATRVLLEAVPPTGGALGAQIASGPVLILGAAQPRPDLGDALAARSIPYCAVSCYDTVPVATSGFTSEQLRIADVVVIAAPSAWRVARTDVRKATTVVVLGDTSASVVAADHELVVRASDGDVAAAVLEVVTRLEGVVDRPA
jgi:uroporphyrinogen-III synthase